MPNAKRQTLCLNVELYEFIREAPIAGRRVKH